MKGIFWKPLLCLFCVTLFFHFLSGDIRAVTISIDSFPTTIDEDPFTVGFSVTGAATADNYFKIDLYKEGTTSYFSETYNGSDWYSGSDGKQYFRYSMVSGTSATINVDARIGNPGSGEFNGPGVYKLKIRRHTASGSDANDTQTPVDVNIVFATPTPTPTPTPTSTPTPTPTLSPTPTPSPAPTATSVPTPTVTQSPSPTTTLSPTHSPNPSLSVVFSPTEGAGGSVLSFSETFGNSQDESVSVSDEKGLPFLAGLMILVGGGFIALSCIPILKKAVGKAKNEYNSSSDAIEDES